MAYPRDGEASALASQTCWRCHGYGLCAAPAKRMRTCDCVLRGVFTAVLRQYHFRCEMMALGASYATVEPGSGFFTTSNRTAEFCADFGIVARRELSDPGDWRIFAEHLIGGHPWFQCCNLLGPLSKKYFYDAVYKLTTRLGKAFLAEGLYPCNEYFSAHCIDSSAMIGRPVVISRRLNKALRVPWSGARPGHQSFGRRHARVAP